jgi:hypothetical protein
MSVGFVGNQDAWKGRKGTAAELFAARIAGSPTVAARARGAEMGPRSTAPATTATGRGRAMARAS